MWWRFIRACDSSTRTPCQDQTTPCASISSIAYSVKGSVLSHCVQYCAMREGNRPLITHRSRYGFPVGPASSTASVRSTISTASSSLNPSFLTSLTGHVSRT